MATLTCPACQALLKVKDVSPLRARRILCPQCRHVFVTQGAPAESKVRKPLPALLVSVSCPFCQHRQRITTPLPATFLCSCCNQAFYPKAGAGAPLGKTTTLGRTSAPKTMRVERIEAFGEPATAPTQMPTATPPVEAQRIEPSVPPVVHGVFQGAMSCPHCGKLILSGPVKPASPTAPVASRRTPLPPTDPATGPFRVALPGAADRPPLETIPRRDAARKRPPRSVEPAPKTMRMRREEPASEAIPAPSRKDLIKIPRPGIFVGCPGCQKKMRVSGRIPLEIECPKCSRHFPSQPLVTEALARQAEAREAALGSSSVTKGKKRRKHRGDRPERPRHSPRRLPIFGSTAKAKPMSAKTDAALTRKPPARVTQMPALAPFRTDDVPAPTLETARPPAPAPEPIRQPVATSPAATATLEPAPAAEPKAPVVTPSRPMPAREPLRLPRPEAGTGRSKLLISLALGTFLLAGLGYWFFFLAGSGATVAGVVKYKGEPVTNFHLEFTTTDGEVPVVAKALPDGKYEAHGVPYGETIITIRRYPDDFQEARKLSGDPWLQYKQLWDPKKFSTLPARYVDTSTSTLRYAVANRYNTHDITVDDD